MTDQMESSKSISFNHDGKDFFFNDPNTFRKVMSKHSDRRKVVKRSTTDYQANLLIVIAICTWIGWTLDEQQQNKISYT